MKFRMLNDTRFFRVLHLPEDPLKETAFCPQKPHPSLPKEGIRFRKSLAGPIHIHIGAEKKTILSGIDGQERAAPDIAADDSCR